MSLLTMFITDLLDDPHQSIEIQDDNAKVPSEDQFVAAYDAGCSSCNEISDDELETTSCCSPSPATHHRPIHHDFKEQYHSPRRPTKRESRCPQRPTKKESRWDTTGFTLEKALCSPRRCKSPSRGANTEPSDELSSDKQDLEVRMPLRSLALPPELGRLPSSPNTNERPQDRIISTVNIVEEAIGMCNDNGNQLLGASKSTEYILNLQQ